MTKPVPYARTIVTDDGVPIDAAHLPGDKDICIVLAHGFTQSWQRPVVWKVATRLNEFGGVVTFDFRGHGRSGGVSTMGDKEIKDVDVAVGYARELGYRHVATIGFSMGASAVLRQAGLIGHVDAVVSVSGPGRWYYRGTRPIDDAAALIAPIPLLIVHGDKDQFFPVDHAERIYAAANEPKELWIVPGFGHAERGTGPQLIRRIGQWLHAAVGLDAGSGQVGDANEDGTAGTVGPVPATRKKAG